MRALSIASAALAGLVSFSSAWAAAETIKIGFNYPQTGPYLVQGKSQLEGATLAVEEINAAGGILGNPIELVPTDSKSNAAVSVENATQLIEKQGVKMIFGGAASSVAVAVGQVASDHHVPFFATLAYSPEVTGAYARKYVFRESYDSLAAAHALEGELKKLQGKKFFYITARYTWGYSTEKAIREISGTADLGTHSHAFTPFPSATDKDIEEAVATARAAQPDVIVLVLFGDDMVRAAKELLRQGVKGKSQTLVPNLTLRMAERAGPEAMEGILGAIPWLWQAARNAGSPAGKRFVDRYVRRYQSYPDTAAASAYTILYEYKGAVERAKTFEGPRVVAALEGHEYTLLKDKQVWRAWDHQSIQTVYAVRCRKASDVRKSRFGQDYFQIIGKLGGEQAFIRQDEWNAVRKAARKPVDLD